MFRSTIVTFNGKREVERERERERERESVCVCVKERDDL